MKKITEKLKEKNTLTKEKISMKKLFKSHKKLMIALIVAILIPIVSVSAAEYEQKIHSYIDMGGGTILYGKYREFIYRDHKIDITPTKLEFFGPNQPNKLQVTLQKKSNKNIAEKTFELSVVGKLYWSTMGTPGARGDYRYVFYTGPTNRPWSRTIVADVDMYSYNP